MRLHSLLIALSLIAYLAIIFPGEKLALPLSFILVLSLFAPLNEPVYFLCILLADVAFIVQCVRLFSKHPVSKHRKDALIFTCLLLPILAALPSLSIEDLIHPVFCIPTGCFVVLYALSIYFSLSILKKEAA